RARAGIPRARHGGDLEDRGGELPRLHRYRRQGQRLLRRPEIAGATLMSATSVSRIAAEDYLAALANQGIDYLFCNPGTDFAPIIEAFARSEKSNRQVPKPLVVPHENAAVGMAHGHYMVSGRPQAVMVHVGLGTANGINCLINASRQHVPIVFTAG